LQDSNDCCIRFVARKVAEVVFEISSDRERRLPNTGWHPESDLPPPVTLNEACLLAKQSLKGRLPEWDAFEVQYVEFNAAAGDHLEANRAVFAAVFSAEEFSGFEKHLQGYAFAEARALLEAAVKAQSN
jgi:hypothetical protein